MSWIESHQTLRNHPKLLRLAKTLKINKAQAIGHLHLLWWWTLDYAPSGSLSAFTSCEICGAAEWQGDEDIFVNALKDTGWINADGTLHDWGEYRIHYDLHMEKQERNRQQVKERVKEFREKKRSCNAPVTLDVTQCNAPNRTEQPEQKEQTIPEYNTTFTAFEKSVLDSWNSFCDRFPILSKVQDISDTRRKKLKMRFSQKTFRPFETVLTKIETQKFLLGDNDRKWKVSFDWLIENDRNHLKVLENRYQKINTERPVNLNAY